MSVKKKKKVDKQEGGKGESSAFIVVYIQFFSKKILANGNNFQKLHTQIIFGVFVVYR